MMDWTDEINPANKIIRLGAAKKACLLYRLDSHRSRFGQYLVCPRGRRRVGFTYDEHARY